MKLLFFCTHFYPYRGGLENYILELTTRLVKKGIDVDILTFNTENTKTYEKYRGVNVYRLPYRYLLKKVYAIPKKNRTFYEIMKKIENKDYDYVITQTRFFYTSYMGMKFAKKHNIKLIHVEHGNSFIKHPNKLVELAAFLYDMTIGRKIFKSAWKVVGISKACCDFARKMGAKNIELIYNSIDTKKFRKVRTNLKERLNIPKYKKIISFVGRLIYAKGVQDLIKATENINNIKVLIVGDGPYKEDLKKLAENRKDILFLGEKNEKEIIEVLGITDIFVNPSYAEGLPTSVLEAGAVGVPIIATDVGGTKEIINKGLNGFLIEPHNIKNIREKIVSLIGDEFISGKISETIKGKIKKTFDWKININKFLKITQ
jgi:glycosyltransferase involved in cell wall biosynthesis